MRLCRFTVSNYGLFQGTHEFDLSPRKDGMGFRNVVLFQGANGVGKTTLFKALSLTLHGSMALDERVSQQRYHDFLLGKLHRPGSSRSEQPSVEALLALEFDYNRSGVTVRVRVERGWQRSGGRVMEALRVTEDGSPITVPVSDYQAWLNDLVPPGLAPVCFFDSEHLKAFSSPLHYSNLLRNVIRRLFGLDTVERLETDLNLYTRRQSPPGRLDELRRTVYEREEKVRDLFQAVQEHQDKISALAADRVAIQSRLDELDREFVQQGGSFARRRPVLQERLAIIRKQIAEVEAGIRELAAHLLPFSLAPALCQQLGERLASEEELQREQLAGELLERRIETFRQAIGHSTFWRGLDVPQSQVAAIQARLSEQFQALVGNPQPQPLTLLHPMSDVERRQLQGWIEESLHKVPTQARKLCQELKVLQDEKRQIEVDIHRAPTDDALARVQSEILDSQQRLAQTEKDQAQANQDLGSLEYRHELAASQVRKAIDELQQAQAAEQRLRLAQRSRLALQAYEDALLVRRVGDLETALLASFNGLCQKDCLLLALTISPDDWTIRLLRADEQPLNLADLSAGEAQLFALALLRALRQVSKRELPLAIDTPLARLDDIHRSILIQDYLPVISDQVLMFAVDTEITEDVRQELYRLVARTYTLRYDPISGETLVTEINDDREQQSRILVAG